VADVVNAIEGPVALTECALGRGNCSLEQDCATRANWQLISRAVRVALEAVSLADMAVPQSRPINVRPRQERTP
jgi:DNA-binding IscR family transcriptional regulator